MTFDKTVQQYLQESEQNDKSFIYTSNTGSTFYYKDPTLETLHRTEKDPNTGLTLPAVEYSTGGKLWKVDGKDHRVEKDPQTGLSLPAYENPDGCKLWFKNGKLHCEDGPAVVLRKDYDNWIIGGHTASNGEWYLNGVKLSPKEIEEQKQKIALNNRVASDENNPLKNIFGNLN